MQNLIARFVKNESGATAIEYGLIAAGISLAIIAAVQRSRHHAEHQIHFDQQLAQVRAAVFAKAIKGPRITGALFSLCRLSLCRQACAIEHTAHRRERPLTCRSKQANAIATPLRLIAY